MAIVIGLDFGNFNSYPSYIEDLNIQRSRLGGKSVDLLPASESVGVPSVFFWNGGNSFLAGRAATTGAAKPERCRVRYLKRSLGKDLEIDGKKVVIGGKQWKYDDAIREVAQSVLREANAELNRVARETTNLVSLAYPATFSAAQRQRLIEIVQSATLEDGRHFQVVGTIMEPAAAALDYLAQLKRTDNTTVLVFDLGGGTFDLSLVTCYPSGKTRANGSTAYYDIHVSDGLPKTGGHEFDQVIYQLLRAKMETFLQENGQTMTRHLDGLLQQHAEQVKKELTDVDRTVYEAYIPSLDDTVPFELTRKEFEEHPRVVEMLAQMTEKARSLLNDPQLPRPQTIVLTGGSCRMPMIRAALMKALPDFASDIDAIRQYKPETAISYGAARYGAPEQGDTGTVVPKGSTSVIKRVAYDIGLRYFHDKEDKKGYIERLIARGTELPVTTPWVGGLKLQESEVSGKKLFEANTPTPDPNEPVRDYRFIKKVDVHFGRVVPEGTRSETRLVVDKDGLVTLEARKDKDSPLFTVEAQLTTTLD